MGVNENNEMQEFIGDKDQENEKPGVRWLIHLGVKSLIIAIL